MKSVGEVMGIGRTFQESFQKALQSLEEDLMGIESILEDPKIKVKPCIMNLHFQALDVFYMSQMP